MDDGSVCTENLIRDDVSNVTFDTASFSLQEDLKHLGDSLAAGAVLGDDVVAAAGQGRYSAFVLLVFFFVSFV